MQEAAVCPTPAPSVKLPVLPCRVCGVIDIPVLGPGRGPHVGELRCQAGHFLKWAPKALLYPKEFCRMPGIARCTVVGALGKHGVEVRYATSGAACAAFTLIVSEVGSDGKVHELYVLCECWGRKAEAASEIAAGQWCLFEGKLARRKKGEQWDWVVSGFELTPVVVPPSGMTGSSN